MKYEVFVVVEARTDLYEIYRYVALNDSVEKANQLLDKLETLIKALKRLPTRSHVPPELSRVGVTDYREVHFEPNRVIYRIDGQRAHIYLLRTGWEKGFTVAIARQVVEIKGCVHRVFKGKH